MRKIRFPLILATAILLSGAMTATAATLITGRQVKDGSLTGKDLKNGSVTRSDLAASARGLRGTQGPAGPQGAQGATGAQGPQGPTGGLLRGTGGGAVTIPPGDVGLSVADCPNGTNAVGGGYSLLPLAGNGPVTGLVTDSNPAKLGTAWTVTARNDGADPMILKTTAVCVTAFAQQ
jgi:hypothetical protein